MNWPHRKRLGWLLAALLISTSLARAAEAPALTFYIQLVRGTDADTPPTPRAALIGAKLGQRLHSVFKWKNYWEIKREAVTLREGEKILKRMSAQQSVEIALTAPHEMTVSMYSNGKLTRKRKQPTDTHFYIAGGDKDATQSWFIVVRRDKP